MVEAKVYSLWESPCRVETNDQVVWPGSNLRCGGCADSGADVTRVAAGVAEVKHSGIAAGLAEIQAGAAAISWTIVGDWQQGLCNCHVKAPRRRRAICRDSDYSIDVPARGSFGGLQVV
jgi:hypothetical protein